MSHNAPPDTLWQDLQPEIPVALLPVRLETRFGTRPRTIEDDPAIPGDQIPVLRVRIYPDDIAVNVRPAALTPAEEDAGNMYRHASTDASLSQHDRDAAWEVLCQRVGVSRAVHVARTEPGAPGQPEAPPEALLMPDGWVIVGEVAATTVFRHYVERPQAPLIMGLSTASQALTGPGPTMFPDGEGLRWLEDFDTARTAGMAAEIDLDVATATRGLDAVYVVGLRSADPEQEVAALTDLLAGHGASDRLAIMAPGTPTNTLTDLVSGWTSTPDTYAVKDRLDANPDVMWSDGTSPLTGGGDSAKTLTTALGITHLPVAIEGSGAFDNWLSRQMNLALFPVTLGQVVGTMVRPTTSTPPPANSSLAKRYVAQLAQWLPEGRSHFADYVRSRGPLPTLRVGRQPYGVLPITPTSSTCVCGVSPSACARLHPALCCPLCLHWSAIAGESTTVAVVADITRRLRRFWVEAATHVPHLGRTGSIPNDLVDVLSTSDSPHPDGYLVSTVLGRLGQQQMLSAAPPVVKKTRSAVSSFRSLTRAILQDTTFMTRADAIVIRAQIGLLFDFLSGSQLEELSIEGTQLLRTWVAHTDSSDPTSNPAAYMRDLLPTWSGRLQIRPVPTDLLYTLLEYSVSLGREQDAQALAAQVASDAFLITAITRIDVVDSGPANGKLSAALLETQMKHLLPQTEGTAYGQLSIGNLVLQPALVEAAAADLGLGREWQIQSYTNTQDAIANLGQSGLSDEDYTGLTGDTLSLVSHRLDAWITSLATARLDTLRRSHPTGLHCGAWGILVDVRPRTMPAANPDFDPAPWQAHLGDMTAPDLHQPLDQIGYVHAPSLPQAVTAGVLRAGEVAHRGDKTTLASIDLTSQRVRRAHEVLDGMEQGQSLGALLGYRLERMLHDRGLHTSVAQLRAAYPQRRWTGAPGEPAGTDDVVPAEVLDGYEVWAHRDQLPLALPADILAALDAVVEGVADLVVAQGVHQLTSGRAEAAGATLTALAYGAQLPEPDVILEPRSGTTITHTLVVADDAGTPGWNVDAPRSLIAPMAERWAERVLGPAGDWTLTVQGTGHSLDSLGVCALDVLHETRTVSGPPVPGAPALVGVAVSGGTALDDRLLAATGAATLDPDPVRERLAALAAMAYAVLATARPVEPGDVTRPPGADRHAVEVLATPGPSPASLADIAQHIADQVSVVQDAILAVVALTDVVPPPETASAALLAPLAPLGIPGSQALSDPVPTPTVAVAASHALSILDTVDTILNGVRRGVVWTQQHPGDVDPLTELNRASVIQGVASLPDGLRTLVRLGRAIAGDAALVCPEVPAALGDLLADVPAGGTHRWLSRMGRVATGVAQIDDLLGVAEAGGHPESLTSFQLPLVPGEGWVAGMLPLADDADDNPHHSVRRPSGPRTHLVGIGRVEVFTAASLSGFVAAEVSEVLPGETVPTAVALHYDAPSARPPQTILLAVHPNLQTPWHWGLAVECVREAGALARLRGVDLTHLATVGLDEYLPLTYIKQREGGADLAALTRKPSLKWVEEIRRSEAFKFIEKV